MASTVVGGITSVLGFLKGKTKGLSSTEKISLGQQLTSLKIAAATAAASAATALTPVGMTAAQSELDSLNTQIAILQSELDNG